MEAYICKYDDLKKRQKVRNYNEIHCFKINTQSLKILKKLPNWFWFCWWNYSLSLNLEMYENSGSEHMLDAEADQHHTNLKAPDPECDGPLPWQVRAQTRTDSTRSSSSTISSDAAGGKKPLPPPVALKPSFSRPNQPSEEQSLRKEEDPANKSFLGKVSFIIVCLITALLEKPSESYWGFSNLFLVDDRSCN